MKFLKIFILLILFFQLSSFLLTELKSFNLDENCLIRESLTENENILLNFNNITNTSGSFYITILSLNQSVDIIINNIESFGIEEKNRKNEKMYELEIKLENLTMDNRIVNFTVNKDCVIEITSVFKNIYNEYQKVDFEMDKEITVKKNNFVIFLGDEDVEKFDMKFNFKDDIKKKNVTYGFINLPSDDPNYLVLGKYYFSGSKLKQEIFEESARQIPVDNPYYEKDKDNLAFIFSIDNGNDLIGEFSFTINSEIINVFLIVSIVIALIFAVITFFLIRRKQTSETGNLDGGDNFYKKDDNEEKDEKEEATEN